MGKSPTLTLHHKLIERISLNFLILFYGGGAVVETSFLGGTRGDNDRDDGCSNNLDRF